MSMAVPWAVRETVSLAVPWSSVSSDVDEWRVSGSAWSGVNGGVWMSMAVLLRMALTSKYHAVTHGASGDRSGYKW